MGRWRKPPKLYISLCAYHKNPNYKFKFNKMHPVLNGNRLQTEAKFNRVLFLILMRMRC